MLLRLSYEHALIVALAQLVLLLQLLLLRLLLLEVISVTFIARQILVDLRLVLTLVLEDR